jgi:hypothetical protein
MRFHQTFVVWAVLGAVVPVALGTFGCAKGTVVGPSTNGGGASGSTEIGTTGNGGSVTIITLPAAGGAASQADAATVKSRAECDGGTDADCTCPPFNVAVIGKPGTWGAVRNGDPPTALMDWLNSSSAGTARADNFTDHKTLTPDFLATYNVIIFASLSEDSDNGPWWTFSADEIAAFQAWVENGGGAIFLSGYSSGPEQAPSNQLLGFTGIQFNQDRVGSCIDWQICGCTNSSTLTDWVQTDPVIASLSTGVTMVGFEGGHSITAPADVHVAATVDNNVGGAVVKASALVGKLAGKGRVLAFGDEWITYTSLWTGAGNPKASDPSCKGFLPQDKYQIAQFWYNMIRWSYPAADCFTIVDSSNPITVW